MTMIMIMTMTTIDTNIGGRPGIKPRRLRRRRGAVDGGGREQSPDHPNP